MHIDHRPSTTAAAHRGVYTTSLVSLTTQQASECSIVRREIFPTVKIFSTSPTVATDPATVSNAYQWYVISDERTYIPGTRYVRIRGALYS